MVGVEVRKGNNHRHDVPMVVSAFVQENGVASRRRYGKKKSAHTKGQGVVNVLRRQRRRQRQRWLYWMAFNKATCTPS
ncbi:hypothetical protein BLOT_000133 [Blomia tropicalis]|nr:hypothetical protein BLOT_000133 [Blomia tropicalis]